ncbi:unnamed protein product [Strongylus vulgaris]|uniref:Uncharacterized protein n=1 Tax=Strongylus vulgaris TaxID=40348 RepID=A0A3P7KUV9_STRVU|nr:unnamed protein product [Strongylus vulgaris]
MAFVATDWTSPLALDSSLIPMLLHLLPMDFCSPSTAYAPIQPCVSARPTMSHTSTDQSDRIFSPRIDVIAVYAERGREMIAREDNYRAKLTDERKIRSIRSKLRNKVILQRSLEEDINAEKSFVESLNSSKSTLAGNRKKSPPAVRPLNESSNYSTKTLTRDLRMLGKKLDEIQLKLGQPAATLENSSISDSQRTELIPEEDSRQESRSEEELEPLPLNYDETGPTQNPMVEMERLDLSLLSPSIDVGRRKILEKSPAKPTKGSLSQPEWMRLIPLEGTNSSRFPLLHYSPPQHKERKESKTERSTQTGISQQPLAEKGCQTKEDERIPPDSGFLDTLERSPRKKVEIIQPMSRQNIEEMLSQM